ncbi:MULTISPECIES: glutaredoxin 3 [Methylosinus]|uniref:Glutaredoxin n=1 Tax=Methylosinus trichosporium (strain ATCC 35070 / NCIMB 11131 / UNIQEM 75 / OB3b) TaxID=595536 RepID=A0A2D2CZ29_METT3|nr:MULTISPECIES: glutaredoxin 3 [Methylosinus]ATQ68001.1 glutaredoxin 3 [Methylosinus trichosporium OB3b]OBS53719.1 glutaredoxin 3 [Methylosinus sp. 3S-1]
MPQIVIYTTSTCPYCRAAKQLLELKRIAYQEIPVDGDPQKRAEMSRLAEGRSTVPQIFIDGQPIGGCDDLYALESAGELDRLLGAGERAS